MKYLKAVGFAFLFGGFFALAAACIRAVVAWFAPVALLDQITLALLGLLGAILYAVGVHQRFERVAGAGLFMPLNGFSAAVAGVFEGARRRGETTAAAFWQGFLLLVKVILSGTFVVMVMTTLVAALGWAVL